MNYDHIKKIKDLLIYLKMYNYNIVLLLGLYIIVVTLCVV